MEEYKISRIAQTLVNNNWINSFEEYNETEIYKSLSRDLIAKKLNKCKYITKITRQQHYNRFITITVTYDNNNRSIYTVMEF